VEATPALLPIVRDLGRRHGAEELGQAALAVVVRVDGELDALRPLDLLEPVRKELQQQSPRLLGAPARNRDGGPSQRKALLSFSKKPSSAR
jgi:hypothetical protein